MGNVGHEWPVTPGCVAPQGCPFFGRSAASLFARKALLLSLIAPSISSRKRAAMLHSLMLLATGATSQQDGTVCNDARPFGDIVVHIDGDRAIFEPRR